MTWIADLCNAITSALTNIGTSLFTFLKDGFTALFLDTSGTTTTISNFGIFAFVMLGVSLAFGLCYYIVNMVRKH